MDFHRQFWHRQPALLFGLTLLIGSSSPLFWGSPWNWLWPCLWGIYLIWLHSWPAILLIAGGAIYSCCLYGEKPVGEVGYFSIASLQPHHSPFQKGLVYKGMLSLDHHRVPCSVYYRGEDPPAANCDYILKGKLQQRGPYDYIFRAKEWTPVEKSWSLAEFRYQLKERFRGFLGQELQSASFLGALMTGDVEERSLRYEFGKLGLQHILAISGFHFAILIAFCSFFFGLFLSRRLRIVVLLLVINAYFLFIGFLPAVQRSWLTAMLYLVGKLIGRHATGLNLLGVALLTEIILDPLMSAHLGFQLSFLSCAGILLFHPIFERLLRRILPKHLPHQLTLFAQHGYLISASLRQALSITLSVNLAILPLLLYHFHQFPFLSLLYNLFFPFLVSVALFGLLVSLLVHLIFPPLSPLFFKLTDLFTSQLLDLVAYPPLILETSLKVPHFPAWIVPFYLFALFNLTNCRLFSKIEGSYGGRSSVG